MYKNHIKRMLDVIISIILIILLIPAYFIVGVLIKVIDRNKIIFMQLRTGLGGKNFAILKFRTMKDGQVTKLGQFLRNASLDEIPQFINVLKGEMSIVGPRPWVPGYYENFNENQKARVNVRPGLVGLAQVNGRRGINVFKKIELDLYYVANVSFMFDFRIILKSLKVVMTKENVANVNGYMLKEIEDLRVSNRDVVITSNFKEEIMSKKSVNNLEEQELIEIVSDSLNDIKNNNVLTLEELRKDVDTWK